MDIRDSIDLIEGKKYDERITVKGRDAYIDGTYVGQIHGGRFRHKGNITPSSGYYLLLPNRTQMYRREATDAHPFRSGEFSYANDLIKQLGYDADKILAHISNADTQKG